MLLSAVHSFSFFFFWISISSLSCVWPHGLQHARLPFPSLTPRVAQMHVHWVGDAIQPSNHPTISSSVIPFSFCFQSFPASGSFPMSFDWRIIALPCCTGFNQTSTWISHWFTGVSVWGIKYMFFCLQKRISLLPVFCIMPDQNPKSSLRVWG